MSRSLARVQAASHCPLTLETWLLFQASPRGICVRQTVTGTGRLART